MTCTRRWRFPRYRARASLAARRYYGGGVNVRPTPDQVLGLAADQASAAAAVMVANPASWSAAGCDDRAIWGQYIATTAEPYDVAVDLSAEQLAPAYRCNCPSRKVPCKHALGLLLLHANGAVVPARRLPFVGAWLSRCAVQADSEDVEAETAAGHDGDESAAAEGGALGGGTRAPREPFSATDPQRLKRQLERAQRMRAGLTELDRWLADRIRQGLASPEFADAATWDRLAQRLVDAQCGGLANRVKRIALKVGQSARWHEELLEELAILHALAVGAQRTAALPQDLSDGVHAATGLTVARDDVLSGVPSTAKWLVAGESRVREDRIDVQRSWICTLSAPTTWAMVLAFGAYGNDLVSEHEVGSTFHGDMHWYPGGVRLRALVGTCSTEPVVTSLPPPASTVAAALAEFGWAIASEPWLERYPLCVLVTPASIGGGAWVLADPTGALPLSPGFARIAELVCLAGGAPITVMGEWGADGFLPLTAWDHNAMVRL